MEEEEEPDLFVVLLLPCFIIPLPLLVSLAIYRFLLQNRPTRVTDGYYCYYYVICGLWAFGPGPCQRWDAPGSPPRATTPRFSIVPPQPQNTFGALLTLGGRAVGKSASLRAPSRWSRLEKSPIQLNWIESPSGHMGRRSGGHKLKDTPRPCALLDPSSSTAGAAPGLFVLGKGF